MAVLLYTQGSLLSPVTILATAVFLLTGYVVSQAIYNVYFHPLSAFPGPWLSRASCLPHVVSLLRGRIHKDVLQAHRCYGPVVRIAPNELVFADARAWNDIMGHRKPGEPEMGKALHFYRPVESAPLTLVSETREAHSRLRRSLAHGFSERSLREQQPIIKGYIDLLMKCLRESSQGGTAKVDMVRWYDCMAFDIIGDLAFGDSFGSLQAGTLHPWVAMIFQSIKFAAWIAASKHVSWLRPFVLLQAPKDLMKKHAEHKRLTREKTLKRIEIGADRPDFMAGLLAKKQDLNLSVAQLEATADILIKAGSETTATVLSGATFLLGMNPDKLAKLTNEVRSAFKSEDEIDYMSVNKLEYMLACLDETMRIYSPVPIGLPRLTPKGGGTICGHYVPEDTTVSLFHYALYHNEKFFALPEEFHPERWLGDPRFANDDRAVFQPFHVGPRNCIGKNLAYIEMRLVLARVLWNFDIKLAEDSSNWMEKQKAFFLYEKDHLQVYLTPRISS